MRLVWNRRRLASLLALGGALWWCVPTSAWQQMDEAECVEAEMTAPAAPGDPLSPQPAPAPPAEDEPAPAPAPVAEKPAAAPAVQSIIKQTTTASKPASSTSPAPLTPTPTGEASPAPLTPSTLTPKLAQTSTAPAKSSLPPIRFAQNTPPANDILPAVAPAPAKGPSPVTLEPENGTSREALNPQPDQSLEIRGEKLAGAESPSEAAVESAAAHQQPAPQQIAATETLAPKPLPEVQPAIFKGLRAGVTKLDEVIASWGEPASREAHEHGEDLVYKLPKFEQVRVSIVDGVVDLIVVDLSSRFDARRVAVHMQIDQLRPALVPDELGQPLGYAYPERGVLLNFGPERKAESVSQVIFERIGAESFLLRSEQALDASDEAALADVEQALKLDSQSSLAHWIKARVLLQAGRISEAVLAAETALTASPSQPEYLLTMSQTLAAAGEYSLAMKAANKAYAAAGAQKELQAAAALQRGNVLADGPARDDVTAIKQHQEALRLAMELIDAPTSTVRRSALETALEANLRIAADVARGPFKDQQVAVSKWLSAAELAAKQLVEHEGRSHTRQLRVAQGALLTLALLPGKSDPTSWANKAIVSSKTVLTDAEDAVLKARVQQQLGVALYDAMRDYADNGKPEEALKCGQEAVRNLEACQEAMSETPLAGYLLGRAYFQVGAVHAVHKRDHETALQWYERAIPRLQERAPESALADVGSQGEAFVSMAISYWEGDHRREAVELTQFGAKLMEEARDTGVLSPESLHVAYRNLSTMHRKLGNSTEAAQYADLAKKTQDTRRK